MLCYLILRDISPLHTKISIVLGMVIYKAHSKFELNRKNYLDSNVLLTN